MFSGGGLSLVMASYLIFGGGTPSEPIVDKPMIEKNGSNEQTSEVIEQNHITTTKVPSSELVTPQQIVTPVVPVVKSNEQKQVNNDKQNVTHEVVEPKPTCTKNQHIVNNKCVNNQPTCTNNQHISNNRCVDNVIPPKVVEPKPKVCNSNQVKVSRNGKVVECKNCGHNQQISNNRCVDNIVPPQLYTLRITTTPSDAHISGVTNGARLKKGSYTITVSKRGYESKTVTINLNSNKHINVSLTKIDIPEPIPRTPVVTPNHPSCAGGISKIRSLISSGQRMEASSLKSRLMASDDCSESEQSVIDDIKP
jgi:hypothetical protein